MSSIPDPEVGVISGDFDNDGDVDVLAFDDENYNSFSFYANNGSGFFSEVTGSSNPFDGLGAAALFYNSEKTLVADFDGDGDVDVWDYEGSNDGDGQSIYLENKNGSFTSSLSGGSNPLSAVPDPDEGVIVGDFNNDGSIDVLAFDDSNYDSFSFFANNGSGSFSEKTGSENPFSGLNAVDLFFNTKDTYVADFDNDGDVDIWDYEGDNSVDNDGVYLKNTTSGFTSSAAGGPNPLSAVPDVEIAVIVGDFDIDGDVDVVGFDSDSYAAFTFYANNGSGSFSAVTGSGDPFDGISASDFFWNANHTYVQDFDNDGDPDIWDYEGENSNDGTSRYYKKQGSPSSSSAPTIATASPSSITPDAAELGGDVTDNGGASVSERGVVYSSTNTDPKIGDAGVTKNANGSGTGVFSETISGLSANTTYYVNAYATNSEGTSYGSVATFTTPNTAPTASGTISPTSLNDDAGPTALFGGIDVSDPDAGETDLALRVTVAIQSAGAISGAGGTSVTNEGGGVFSISGSFDPSSIDTALDNLRFNPADNTGDSGTFNTDLTVQVNDQESGFVDVSGPTNVTVTRINDAPTVALGSTSGAIDENNSPPTVLTSITVSDPDGGTNDLTLSGAEAGAFNINGSDELELTSTADFETKSSYDVTVEVNDPNVGSGPDDSESFSLSINDVNDPPTVATTGSSTDEGTSDTITQGELAATDAEEGPAGLTYTIDTDVSEGQLYNIFTSTQLDNGDTFTQEDLNDGLIEYRHDGTEPASESFGFTVRDGAGGSASGTFTITIDPVNDAPTVATNQTLSVNEGASADLSQGLLEATDPDDATSDLNYTIGTDVQNGQIVNTATSTQLGQGATFTQANINSGDIEYRHNGSETTADAFDFTVADGNGGSASGTFDVSVSPQNDAPVANADDYTGGSGTDEDTPLSISTRSGGVLPNDADEEDNNADLSVAGVEGGSGNTGSTVTLTSGATVTVASNGTFTYDPNGQFESLGSGDSATDSFTYTTEDDGGAVSSSATVTVQISGVNDAPSIAGDQSLSVDEGDGVTLASADLDGVDPDDSPSGLTYSVTSAPSSGEVQVGGTQASSFTETDLDDGDVTYVHDNSETTSDAFDVKLTDGGEDGASAATATINVSITLQNDDPTVATNTESAVDEGANDLITQSELETTDPEQGPASLTYTIDSDVTEGDLFNTGPSPATQLDNGDTFTQKDINDGNVEYRHGGNEPTSESVEFTVADGQGGSASATFSITINPVNDGPSIAGDQSLSTSEGTGVTLASADLDGVDPDDSPSGLTYSVTSAPSTGEVQVAGTQASSFTETDLDDGDVTYVHDDSETPSDAFDVKLTDGGEDGASAVTATINVSITLQNDDPTVATNTESAVDEGANDLITQSKLETTDPEQGPAGLTYTIDTDVSEGQLYNIFTSTQLDNGDTFTQEDLNDGLIEYRHDGTEPETGVGFDFTVRDGAGGSTSDRFSFTINQVNDAPTVATNQTLSVNEGASADLSQGLLEATDPDDAASALTYTIGTDVQNGQIVNTATSTQLDQGATFTQADINSGDIEYRHNGSETMADDFTFELTDDDGAGPTSRTFSITVTPQNDAPTVALGSTSGSINENNSPPTTVTAITVSDPDGGTNDLSLSGADAGVFSINASNDLEFTATADFETQSSYSVTVDVDDSSVGSDPDDSETFSLAINDVNEPPTVALGATSGSIDENNSPPTAVTTVTINDDAPGTNTLSLSGADAGAFNINGSDELEFATTADFETESSYDVTVEVNDPNVGSDPDSESFSLSINDVNDSPTVATNTGSSTDEGTNDTITQGELAATDAEEGPAGLTYTIDTDVTEGHLYRSGTQIDGGGTFTQQDINDGNVEYRHGGNEPTGESVEFTVADGQGGSASATFSITINPVNDGPSIAGDQSLSTSEGTGVTLASADLDGVDPDDSPSGLTYSVTSAPSTGEVRVAGTQAPSFTETDLDDGDVTYVHNDSETGSDAFKVELADGKEDGASAATATINVMISIDTTPEVSITDGSTAGLDVPARVRPGTDNNPLGVFSLKADRVGASLDEVKVTNSAPGTEGLTRARLFWSTDKRLDVGTDTELDRVALDPSDAPKTITFGGFSQSIPTAPRYAIVALDVDPGVTAEAVQLTLAQTADLQTPGGEIETVNGTAQTSFPNLALSNGKTRLPLRLSDFGATLTQDGGSTEREQIPVGDRLVRVTWQAANERNNEGFEVQRKQAGAPATAWAKVGFVKSTSSGSVRANGPDKSAKAATEYRFDDVVAFTAGSLEYRLRQESTDGSASFYKPATVTSESVQEVKLLGTFPNPARSQATVRFAVPEGKAADVTLRLYDLLGRQVQTVRRAADAGRHELRLDVSRLSSGAYFLRLGTDGTFKTRKIVVTR